MALLAVLAAAGALLHAPHGVHDASASEEPVRASSPCDDAADEPAAPVPSGGGRGPRLRVDEMPAVEVVGRPAPELREEDRVGENEQPRWTAHRRFPSTRIYVIPPWQVDVEYWLRAKVERDGPNTYEHRQEIEIGLPYRFQFDFYLIETHEDGSDEVFVDQSFELRYAFAKWGRIPFNPTTYFEWIHREGNRPEKFELKLLLGDELAPRWHWGTNFIWEQELGGARETVVEWTPAISYTILDEVLSVGAEGKLEVASEEPRRNRYVENLRLGPSLQWRPLRRLHVDVAPLFGLNSDSRLGDLFLVAGWEF
jgi:hypothetical protein